MIVKFFSLTLLPYSDFNLLCRFVLGTRIQKGPKAHKKASCQFHDLDLARQGAQEHVPGGTADGKFRLLDDQPTLVLV